ncbi:MAG TPA: NADH-quinone oxidoreductase subunit A [Opitutaceae bacterium]|jgi:NADH-quinone oxidoreductase subunit A|nr:NADH-quinone oxidoreductase subunit A [Opitutaceae bacterium]
MMSSAAYLPFLYQIVLAAGIAAAIIGASHFFGQRARKNRIQDTAYECGIEGGGLAHARFSVKFYLIALLFTLFDIEVIFLVPWTFIYREFLAQRLPILVPILVFLGLLALGLVYEMKKGALDWER